MIPSVLIIEDERILSRAMCDYLTRHSYEPVVALCRYHWPGNVRELANVLERVVLLHEGDQIHGSDLGLAQAPAGAGAVDVGASGVRVDFSRGGVRLADVERALIIEALKAAGNNRRRAAQLLDISFETLRYRLEKYGIEPGEQNRLD